MMMEDCDDGFWLLVDAPTMETNASNTIWIPYLNKDRKFRVPPSLDRATDRLFGTTEHCAILRSISAADADGDGPTVISLERQATETCIISFQLLLTYFTFPAFSEDLCASSWNQSIAQESIREKPYKHGASVILLIGYLAFWGPLRFLSNVKAWHVMLCLGLSSHLSLFPLVSTSTYAASVILIECGDGVSLVGRVERRRYVQWAFGVVRFLDEYEFAGCHLYVQRWRSILEVALVLHPWLLDQIFATPSGSIGKGQSARSRRRRGPRWWRWTRISGKRSWR